jgi:hypothetical protein
MFPWQQSVTLLSGSYVGSGDHNDLKTNLIVRGPKKEAEIPNEMSFLFNNFLLIAKLQVCDPGFGQ